MTIGQLVMKFPSDEMYEIIIHSNGSHFSEDIHTNQNDFMKDAGGIRNLPIEDWIVLSGKNVLITY